MLGGKSHPWQQRRGISVDLCCALLQFVCVESIVTAVVDMYPKVFRRGYRRELLILGLSIVSYFLGLIMLTEVRAWLRGKAFLVIITAGKAQESLPHRNFPSQEHDNKTLERLRDCPQVLCDI